ncbi:MAG: histidinol dehydrogenase, partial [Gammaproteobacteria bacterium]|nr:histidinol dehydrogenase [Gammaproteobacteria bacterium]
MIAQISSTQADFQNKLSKLLAWESVSNADVAKTVDDIIAKIKTNGDQALVDYSVKFDGVNASDMSELTIKSSALKEAFDGLNVNEKTALQSAADRVRDYHQKQKQDTWTYTEDNGTMLGQKITPLDRVGLYVPGGKAAYPSSVLMNAIPAKVAGVEELIMVVPTPNGVTNQLVLAAAYISGVDQ